MPRNYDFDVPSITIQPTQPVLENNFTSLDEIPIFWGPWQLNTGLYTYNEPSQWRSYEQLNIPQVIRFIFVGPEEYDTDDYNTEEGPPGDLVPWSCTYIAEGYGNCSGEGGTFCVRMRSESGIYYGSPEYPPFTIVSEGECE